MTWLNSDYWKHPTIDKSGYPGIPSRQLSHIDTLICHSAEGWASNIMNIQNDPARRASWPETVLLDGTRWAHYEVEKVTWTSGTIEANIRGYAVEFEGVKGQPITDEQVLAAAEIYRDLKAVCPNLKAPVLGQGFEEHRRVSGGATTCPNDRIRWNDIAAQLNEEDDMTEEEVVKIISKYLKSPVDDLKFGTPGEGARTWAGTVKELITDVAALKASGGETPHRHNIKGMTGINEAE